MQTLSERIAGERSRLRAVRMALTAATAQGAQGNADWVPFYIAIADYFDASMARLHRQDIRMGDMLRDKADMDKPANQEALAELDERLEGNQHHLKAMLAAADELRTAGATALEAFEAAGGAYSQFIVDNMGHHSGTTDLARELFSTDDWEYMASVSEAAQQHERALFDQVFATQPADLQLPEA